MDNYSITASLLPRLLGVIYLYAFGAYIYQMKGLFGKNGILPISYFHNLLRPRLGKKRFFYLPSLFWFNSSDWFLQFIPIFGAFCGLFLILNSNPLTAALLLFIIYFLHLSICSSGQEFLGFGWELFLSEITINVFFLTLSSPPNPFIWWSLNLTLFRCHLQGGASKLLSRDKNWRNLTATAYHYNTQPIPNVIAWYAYKLPLWFQKLSTVIMLFIEIVVPFALFFTPQEVRFAVFILFAGLQFTIWLTGNFSYLNHLTFVLSTILIGNLYLSPFLSIPAAHGSATIYWMTSLIGATLILLQLVSLWNYFFPLKRIGMKIFQLLEPFHVIGRYGIFAVMTTARHEIIIEGSDDGTNWKEYTFHFKPSEVNRRPRRISPYQPRLDWMVWFLPFSPYSHNPWFQKFLFRLLTGSKDVLKLIRTNPFPDHPPKFIRALAFDYVFSDYKTRKESGAWWKRHYIYDYSPILTLEEKTLSQSN